MPVEAMVEAILFLAEQREIAEVSEARHAEIRRKDAERKRKSKGNPVEVPTLAPVLDNISKPSLEVSKKESITSDSFPQDPPGFKDFWAVYPQRAGDRDRKPATKAFSAALRRVDLKTLLWGTERYAADCKAKGKINTEYVKQARTWLNSDGWTETYATQSSDNFSSARLLLERIGRA